MEIYSSIGKMAEPKPSNSYAELAASYTRGGFTHKSNEILHKIAESSLRNYPYELLLLATRIFHLNQFEPCYHSETEIFGEDIEYSQSILKIIAEISYRNLESRSTNLIIKASKVLPCKKDFDYCAEDNEAEQLPSSATDWQAELKKILLYLLVLGYSVKYYLNEQISIKPYDQEMKNRHPTFFSNVFNKWARKYGNTVLATTPRRINAYYLSLAVQLDSEDRFNSQETDCQYRNYNEIVEELIKATTEIDDNENINDQEIPE